MVLTELGSVRTQSVSRKSTTDSPCKPRLTAFLAQTNLYDEAKSDRERQQNEIVMVIDPIVYISDKSLA